MAIPIYIDVNSGEVRDSLNGPVRRRLKFYLNDLTPLNIAFIQNGAVITTSILEVGSVMRVGIRAKPGQGGILAEVNTHTLSGQEARVVLPMNSSALTTYFANANYVPLTQNEATLVLEIEVTSSGGTTRCTYYQAPCIVAREVNI